MLVCRKAPPLLLQGLEVPKCEKFKVPKTAAEAVYRVYKVVLDSNINFQGLRHATAHKKPACIRSVTFGEADGQGENFFCIRPRTKRRPVLESQGSVDVSP